MVYNYLMLEMRKLELREVKELAQGHTASLDLKLDLSDFKDCALKCCAVRAQYPVILKPL